MLSLTIRRQISAKKLILFIIIYTIKALKDFKMDLQVSHDILVAGPDLAACKKKVLMFFKKNMLVRYDTVTLIDTDTINADHPLFETRLENGTTNNRTVIAKMIEELKVEGFKQLDDIQEIIQGYNSKIFHTIAHLLDGFFGVDSFFYNLEEDSHGVTDNLRQQIEASPKNFWLIKVQAESKSSTADRLHILRSFKQINGQED